MPKVDVVDLKNTKVGEVELADAVFAAPVNEGLIYESVRNYLAGLRGGNAKTKSRWEVAGSGKKLWRQKGTGRARMGSVRSTLWRHGATTHGPQPRDYGYRLNKKMVTGALRSALSAKLRDGELVVVDGFSLTDHKTKSMASVVETLGASARCCWSARTRRTATWNWVRGTCRRETGGDQGRVRLTTSWLTSRLC